MKTINALALAVVLASPLAVSAADANVTSANTFAIMKVNSTAKRTYLAVPWGNFGSEDANIAVSNYLKTASLTAGDKLFVCDSGNYKVWQLDGNGVWQSQNTVPEGTTVAGNVVSAGSSDATSIPTGTFAVLLRPSAQDTSIYLYGQVRTSASGSTTVSVAPNGGVNILSAPGSLAATNLPINSLTWSGLTASTFKSGRRVMKDVLSIYSSTGAQTDYYWNGSAWCTNGIVESEAAFVPVDSNVVIPAGMPFHLKNAAEVTITWPAE